MAQSCVFAFCLVIATAAAFTIPTVTLKNAARADVEMPMLGLGTFGYGTTPEGQGGEYWNQSLGHNATLEWLKLGGRRIDSAHSYHTQLGVGQAIIDSGVIREDIFLLSKIPASGYNDTIQHFHEVLSNLSTTYVDAMLIHWPGPCSTKGLTPAQCRQQAWQAISDLYDQNLTRAIGVSNFESNHIEDLLELDGYVPAMNQIEFHCYWHEYSLKSWCNERNIHLQSYAPLGAPDHMAFYPTKWPTVIPDQPDVAAIAKKHNVTVGQTLCRWATQQDISINPRTYKSTHMLENLNSFEFDLTVEDIVTLDNLPNTPVAGKNKVCPDPHTIP
eukprot:m.241980 g.241980  ORF g.241980 m.241980 type:complete len:330 (-) comp17451_c0_seq1:65-1054(-)